MVKPINQIPRDFMRQRRIEEGLNTREMAEIFGISFQHYNDIETGRRNPGRKLAEKMARLFQVKLDKFFEHKTKFKRAGEK